MKSSVISRFSLFFAILFLFLLIVIRMFTVHEDPYAWQLGVDLPVVYSPVIKLDDDAFIVSGSQTHVGEENTIQYTLLEKGSFGFYHPVETVTVKGDQSYFVHKFTNMTPRSDVRIKIENFSRCLCRGKIMFKDITADKK